MRWIGILSAIFALGIVAYSKFLSRGRVAIWAFNGVRKTLITLGVIAAAIAAANYAPLLNTHGDQDNCTFGPVSNEQYRAYLAEARRRERAAWPAFSNDGQEITRQLNVRLSDMIGEEPSLYKRLAIMHATLRAIGAEYLNTNGRQDIDPYEAAPTRRENVRFDYQVDINRLVLFQPYPRQVWILVDLGTRQNISQEFGVLSAVAHVLYFIDRPPDQFLASFGKSCPPVPRPETAARYEAKQR